MRKFRTRAKLHFLTYPQCDIPLQEMMNQLKQIAGERFGWALIAAEDHEERENDSNVGVHRHVMQEYCKNFETENQRYWDLKYNGKTYHPHFEPTKNKAKCLQYCMKDGEYIYEGTHKDAPFTPDVYLQANKSKQGYGFTYIATQIKAGKTMDDLDEEMPGHVLNHKRKIEEYQQFQQEKAVRREKKPAFHGFKIPRNYDWELIAKWANDNFMKPRQPRQPQLWIWSRQPEMGKTYPWAIIMRKYFNCYEWIYGPKQGKEILSCDYILIDELKGGITITELKSLSQMYGMNLDIKYGAPTFFNKNVPLIITSNLPPSEIYHKCKKEDLESLESRFLIVNVDEACHLEPLQEPIVEPTFELTPVTTRHLLGSPTRQPEPEPEPVPQPEPDQPVPEDKQDLSEDRNYEDHSEESNDQFEIMEQIRREEANKENIPPKKKTKKIKRKN